jgi:glycosyltransferase involved in cell wall biosynthesis
MKKAIYLCESNTIHVQRWANYFASLGWQIHIVAYKLCSQNELIEGVIQHRILNTHTEIVNIPIIVPILKRLIKKIKPDIIHAHGLPMAGVYGGLTNFHPFILTNWGMMDLTHIEGIPFFGAIKLDPFTRKLRQNAFDKADVITALVNEGKEKIIQAFSVPPEKIKVFSWGVDLEIFNPNRKSEAMELKKSLSIDPDAFVVMSNRYMSEFYNIHNIVKAMKVVTDAHPETIFVFRAAYGEKKYIQRIKGLVDDLGLTEKARFVDKPSAWVDIPIYYNMADVTVMIPNKDQGPLSLPEAIACGSIPIVTDISGNREWVIEGETGFLVDPQNINDLSRKIILCIENRGSREFRNKFIQKSGEMLQLNGDFKKGARLMEEIYGSLLARYDRNG